MGFMDRLKGAAESAQAATSKVGVGASAGQMDLANRVAEPIAHVHRAARRRPRAPLEEHAHEAHGHLSAREPHGLRAAVPCESAAREALRRGLATRSELLAAGRRDGGRPAQLIRQAVAEVRAG